MSVDLSMPKFLPTEEDKTKWAKEHGEDEAQNLAGLATTLASMSEEEILADLQRVFMLFSSDKAKM